jgi:hypothetical protein
MGIPAAGGDGVLGGIVDGVGSRTDPALIGKITHPVLPVVPEAFVATGLPEAWCKVRIFTDETGTVTQVDVVDCLEILQAPTLAAAYATRFAPLLDETNTPRKNQFVIRYCFRIVKPDKDRDKRRAARSARREGRH